MWKKFITDYFTFSKNDRYAVGILILVIAAFIFLPKIWPRMIKSNNIAADQNLISEIKQLISDSTASENKNTGDDEEFISDLSSVRLKYFDPNHISVEEWVSLGVSRKSAETIGKYLSKGGKFKTPEDLFKIYNLDKKTVNRLLPYIRIEPPESSKPFSVKNASISTTPPPAEESSREFIPKKKYTTIDINSADTALLKTLPGIGEWRSLSIVRYRDALGGFITTEQLSEVKNLPDSVIRKIEPYLKLHTGIKKINLNTAEWKDLVRHPYLNPEIATAIIRYRTQNGPFSEVEKIFNIHSIDENQLEKAMPYLSVR